MNRSFPKILRRSGVALLAAVLGVSALGQTASNADASTTVTTIAVTITEDGQAPFDATAGPGNDTGSTNNTVRAGQLVKYKFTMTLNDPNAANPTPYTHLLISTDPLPLGIRWDVLPPACLAPGSSITGDGVTTQSRLTCDMGTWSTGSTWTLSPNIRATPYASDNTSFDVHAVLSSVDFPAVSNSTSPSVTVRTQPRLDIVASPGQFHTTWARNGVPGGVYSYGMGLKYKPGSEAVTQPITWTDDISGISPNAVFLSCGVSGYVDPVSGAGIWASTQPYGKISSLNWNSHPSAIKQESALADSGTVSCTPDGTGQVISVTASGINPDPAWYPTKSFANEYALTVGDNWVASYAMAVWIPYTEFTPGNSYAFTATNKISAFEPDGVNSGAPNFGDYTLEPGRGLTNQSGPGGVAGQSGLVGTQNWYQSVLYRPSPGGFDKTDYKYADNISSSTFYGNMTAGNSWSGYIGSNYRSGDGVLAAGSRYSALIHNHFYGIADIAAGYMDCMTIDNVNTHVEPLPGHPTRGAYIANSQAAAMSSFASWVIEYGTGGANGVGSTWATEQDQREGRCENSDSPAWYTDLTAVPGGPESITKVRFRTTDVFTIAEQGTYPYHYMTVLLKVRNDAAIGAIAPNFGKLKDPGGTWVNSPSTDNWIVPSYNSTTALGSYGDRITVVGTRVRTTDTAPVTSFVAGADVTFQLANTSDSLGVTPPGLSTNVLLVDTLPEGLSYNPGSATCSSAAAMPSNCEPTIVVNFDGTSTLTWDFGTFTAGSAMSTITFTAASDRTIQDGASRLNSATISASNDNSPVGWRTSTASVNFFNPSAFGVSKRVLTPQVEVGEPITYRTRWSNISTDPQGPTDFIDWLPWNGDNRNPATTTNGSTVFTSITSASGTQTNTIKYTKYDRTLLTTADSSPTTMSGAIVWCSAFDGSGGASCPASASEVTGLRFEGAVMPSGASREYDIVMTPLSNDLNKVGNIYTNRFKGSVSGLGVVESNNAPATVVGSSVGDIVWHDLNKNGVKDAGENGVAGVSVKLFDSNGTEVRVGPDGVLGTADDAIGGVVTGTNGEYLFDDLHSGQYSVGFGAPSGWTRTLAQQGANASADSDANVATGRTALFTLGVASVRNDIDAGLWKVAKLSGHIYLDPNSDNSHAGSGDTPLNGVQVSLTGTTADGTPITLFANTNSLGYYEFANLVPSDSNGYTIVETQPLSYNDHTDYAGSHGGTVSNDTVTGIVLRSDDNAINYDFTEKVAAPTPQGSASIAGSVKINGTATGIAGVIVTLSGNDANGNPVSLSTTTSSTGAYSFTSVPPSSVAGYTITETQPSAYVDAIDAVGSHGGTAGNDVLSGIVLANGDAATNYNFTETVPSTPTQSTASLSGNVLVTGTLSPINGVIIELTGTDSSGNAISLSTLTGVDGSYSFTNVPVSGPSGYTVRETQPAGFTDDTDILGSKGGVLGNDVFTGIQLAPNDIAINYNFREVVAPTPSAAVASLSGKVRVTPSNTGISGVIVTLTGTDAQGNAITMSTQTDSTGVFNFASIPASNGAGYTLTETQPAGYNDSTETVGSKGGVVGSDQFTGIVLVGGDAAVNYIFSETVPSTPTQTVASLSGLVKVSGTNAPIAGTIITLTGTDANGNAISMSTVSAVNGSYSFSGIPPSDATGYTITETQPAGYLDSTETVGSAGGVAGNDVITGVVLAGGAAATGYVFSESVPPTPTQVPASLTGAVTVTATSTPIIGVLITLTGKDFANNDIALYAVTDANGVYSFPNVPASDSAGYTVTETQPHGYPDAADSIGSVGGNLGNDVMTGVVLTSGTAAINYNFTEGVPTILPTTGSASIAGSVTAGVGAPIAGVLITLTGSDSAGNPITMHAVTGSTGQYVFTSVPASGPAGYTVTETQPSGFVDGAETIGSKGGTITNDSFGQIVVVDGDVATGYNFAETVPPTQSGLAVGSLSGKVNLVGGVDPSAGIAGVVITLTGKDSAGNDIVLSTVTASDGSYTFTNVPVSDSVGYTLTETQPVGYNDDVDFAGSLGGSVTNDAVTGIILTGGASGTGYNFAETAPPIVSPAGTASVHGAVRINGTTTGIAGVVITLNGSDSNGNVISLSRLSGADGTWAFDNVPASNSAGYTITETQPAGYNDNTDSLGTKGGVLSNDSVAGIVLVADDVATGYLFTESVPTTQTSTGTATVTGKVQVVGSGTGIAGVVVRLEGKDTAGNSIVLTTTTGTDGVYNFANVPASDATGYMISETQPAGYDDSNESAGTHGGTVGSDWFSGLVVANGDIVSGYIFNEAVPPTQPTTGTASIEGHVRASTTGIAGVLITLSGTDRAGNAILLTVLTDSTGKYLFTSVPASNSSGYTVRETQPAGFLDGTDEAGSAGGTVGADLVSGIVIADGVAATGYNFNETAPAVDTPDAPAEISGRVVNILTGQGIIGTVITLSGTDAKGNAISKTTATGVNGTYSFVVPPGTYSLRETQPTGYVDDADTAGSAGGDVANDVITNIVVGSGDTAQDYTFTETTTVITPPVPATISGRVTERADGSGIANVAILLSGVDAFGNQISMNVYTDANGNYRFINVPAGEYTLTEVQPDMYADLGETVGSVGGTLSGTDSITRIQLSQGTVATGYDFVDERRIFPPGTPVTPTSTPTSTPSTTVPGTPATETTTTVPGATTSTVVGVVGSGATTTTVLGVSGPASTTTVPSTPNSVISVPSPETTKAPVVTTTLSGSTSSNSVPTTTTVSGSSSTITTTTVKTTTNGSGVTTSTSIGGVIGAVPNSVPTSVTQTTIVTGVSASTTGGSVTGSVYRDRNGNGTRDPDEKGVARARVFITRPDGTTDETITDESGMFVFAELPDGTYTVGVMSTTNPTNGARTKTVKVEGGRLNASFGFSDSGVKGIQTQREVDGADNAVLAFTGANTPLLVAVALGLIVLGSILSRRRRPMPETPRSSDDYLE